jgi:hypothetical protein
VDDPLSYNSVKQALVEQVAEEVEKGLRRRFLWPVAALSRLQRFFSSAMKEATARSVTRIGESAKSTERGAPWHETPKRLLALDDRELPNIPALESEDIERDKGRIVDVCESLETLQELEVPATRRFGQSSGSSGVGVGLGRGRPDAPLESTGACSRMSLTGPQSGGGADPMYRVPLGSRHFTS